MNPTLDRLKLALGSKLPPALAAADGGDPIPLAIGIDEPLIERLVTTRGFNRAAAQKLVRGTLRELTRSHPYRCALCDEGAWRHDLDGNRVERVDTQAALTAALLMTNRTLFRQRSNDAAPKPSAPKAAAPKAAPSPRVHSPRTASPMKRDLLTLPKRTVR